jgi:hypothetical protein
MLRNPQPLNVISNFHLFVNTSHNFVSGLSLPCFLFVVQYLSGLSFCVGAHAASYWAGTENFLRDEATGGVKMTTDGHLVPNVRMNGALPPLPMYLQIKHRENFTLAFLTLILFQYFFDHSGPLHMYSFSKKTLLNSV